MYEYLPTSTRNPSADTFEGCMYGFMAGSPEGLAILDWKPGLLLSGSLLKAESLFQGSQEKRGTNISTTFDCNNIDCTCISRLKDNCV